MRKARIAWMLALIIAVALRGYAEEGEENQKAAKVTTESLSGQEPSQPAAVSSGMEQTAATDAAIEKDLDTITAEVAGLTLFTVIKVAVLAMAIGGIACFYIPRRTKGGAK